MPSPDETPATADAVIQEIWNVKETLARSMGFDIDRILEDARKKQQASGRVVLSPPVQPQAEI